MMIAVNATNCTSQVAQARADHRLLETLEDLLDTPDKERVKSSYSDKLIRLCALCATQEFYHALVETYGL